MRRKSIFAALVFALLFVLCIVTGCAADESDSTSAGDSVYTVKFVNGEDELAIVRVVPGNALKEEDFPAPPAVSQSEFVGWYLEEEEIVEGYTPKCDIVVRAKYNTVYTVIFYIGDNAVKTVAVLAGGCVSEADFPVAEEKGFVCEGWTAGKMPFTAQTIITSDMVVCASLKRVWSVAFTVNGISLGNPLTVCDGQNVSNDQLPVFSPEEGYVFDGWFVGNTPLSEYQITEDTVFTARLTRVYNVRFFDGEVFLTNVSVREGEAVAENQIPQVSFRDRYTFDGWFVGGTLVEQIIVTEDITVIAKFTRIYTVTFQLGENSRESLSVREGERADESLFPVVFKTGYAFLGWYTQSYRNLSEISITDDVSVFPLFVGEESYDGVWVCEEEDNEFLVVIDSLNGTLTIGSEIVDCRYSFEEDTGKITVSNLGGDSYSLLAIGNRLTLTKYDHEAGGVLIQVLFKEVADTCFPVAGVYRKEDTVLVISDAGYVLSYHGAVQYGKVTESGNGYMIQYKSNSDSNMRSVAVSVDGSGNLILRGGISSAYNGLFVKDVTAATVYRCDGDTFTVYTVSDGYVFVYYADAVSQFVSPSALPSAGQKISFSVNGDLIEIQVTEEGIFEYI